MFVVEQTVSGRTGRTGFRPLLLVGRDAMCNDVELDRCCWEMTPEALFYVVLRPTSSRLPLLIFFFFFALRLITHFFHCHIFSEIRFDSIHYFPQRWEPLGGLVLQARRQPEQNGGSAARSQPGEAGQRRRC